VFPSFWGGFISSHPSTLCFFSPFPPPPSFFLPSILFFVREIVSVILFLPPFRVDEMNQAFRNRRIHLPVTSPFEQNTSKSVSVPFSLRRFPASIYWPPLRSTLSFSPFGNENCFFSLMFFATIRCTHISPASYFPRLPPFSGPPPCLARTTFFSEITRNPSFWLPKNWVFRRRILQAFRSPRARPPFPPFFGSHAVSRPPLDSVSPSFAAFSRILRFLFPAP